MTVLHELYGLHPEDARYRGKLKARIQIAYPEKLLFLSLRQNTAEVVVSAEGVNSYYLFNDQDQIIKQAADYLRNDILDYAKRIPKLTWRPNVEELNSEERNLPECLTSFISRLLTGSDQKQYESTSRLIQLYSSNLVYGVTRGKVITAKHFLLELGLHNITSQKKPVEINQCLGHSIDYK